jgi:hypothetical protein
MLDTAVSFVRPTQKSSKDTFLNSVSQLVAKLKTFFNSPQFVKKILQSAKVGTILPVIVPPIPEVRMIVDALKRNDAETHARSRSTAKDEEQAPAGVVPTSADILCGTGHEKKHSGNHLFRLVLCPFVDAYANAQSKVDKIYIVRRIVNLLFLKKMRFLKKSSNFNCWYVASQKVGRDKIGHFLRFHQHSRRTKRSATMESLSPHVSLTAYSSSSLSSSTRGSDVLEPQSEGSIGGTESSEEGVQSAKMTDEIIVRSIDSKGADERPSFLQFPWCHGYHNTASHVVTSASSLLPMAKYYNLYEIEVPLSNHSCSTSTEYVKEEFDSALLMSNQSAAAPSSTSSYTPIVQKDLDDKGVLYHTVQNLLYPLPVPATESEEGKHQHPPWLCDGASKGLPWPSPANMLIERNLKRSSLWSSKVDNDTERTYFGASVDQSASLTMFGSIVVLLPDNDDGDEPLFCEQDLAARLD